MNRAIAREYLDIVDSGKKLPGLGSEFRIEFRHRTRPLAPSTWAMIAV